MKPRSPREVTPHPVAVGALTPTRLARAGGRLAVAGCLMLAACAPDQATRLGLGKELRLQAPDKVAPEALQAGLTAMRGRVVRTDDAYAKIEPKPDGRYFMHPTMAKDAVIVFDVRGLHQVVLAPRILDIDRACARDPDAARVALRYQVDQNAPVTVDIDRNWDRTIPVALHGATELRAAVNHGNGVITCDWFGLGMINVR